MSKFFEVLGIVFLVLVGVWALLLLVQPKTVGNNPEWVIVVPAPPRVEFEKWSAPTFRQQPAPPTTQSSAFPSRQKKCRIEYGPIETDPRTGRRRRGKWQVCD